MNITHADEKEPWLLLVFSLPSEKASERVQIWRKLQKFGAIPFRNAGSLLPYSPENEERFAWLETLVRSHAGEASTLELRTVSDLPVTALQHSFREARTEDFKALIQEMVKMKAASPPSPAQLIRFRRRLEDLIAIDFFTNPLRKKAESALVQLENPQKRDAVKATRKPLKKADYQGKTWVTRYRPGIDRVASAWLISRFIDARPKFIFGDDPAQHPKAVPFDMYGEHGFGHEGDKCTFETLCHSFAINNRKVLLIAQAVHDADIEDDKFGRNEGNAINQILRGWAKQDRSDDELLRRGIDLLEGLYESIQ